MGIDYVVDLDCAPKRALGTEKLIELVKQRSRGETLLQLARERGDERPAEELTVDVVIETPSGTQRTKASAKQLIERAAPLEAHRGACVSCPADRGVKGFGCYRSIPYPIPTVAEEWLLSRLPDELEGTTAGIMLENAIADFGWDGAQAARMRAKSGIFFEATTPASVTWGDVHLDANQVFHMMFGLGPPEPSHSLMLALFFDVIPHDTPAEVLEDDARAASVLATAGVPPQSDPGIERMADFLRTLPLAARLGVNILLDT